MLSPGVVIALVGVYLVTAALIRSYRFFELEEDASLEQIMMLRFHLISGLFLIGGGLVTAKIVPVID